MTATDSAVLGRAQLLDKIDAEISPPEYWWIEPTTLFGVERVQSFGQGSPPKTVFDELWVWGANKALHAVREDTGRGEAGEVKYRWCVHGKAEDRGTRSDIFPLSGDECKRYGLAPPWNASQIFLELTVDDAACLLWFGKKGE